MATTVDNYKVKVTVEGREGLKNLKQDMEGLSQIGGPLGGTINGILGKLGPLGMAAGLAATAFAALGGKALSLAADLSDIAGATGIATGTLLNFRQSVVEAGGKAEDFAQIASKLNQSVQEANSGNEKFQKSFQDLGVFVTDANGKLRPTEEILRDITQRFQGGELTSKQYAAAIDILGKNINKLELSKLQAVADPIKTEQIKQIDRYNEAIDKLTEKINSGLITAFGKLAIAINNAFDTSNFAKLEEEANKRGETYRERTEGFMNRPLFGQEPEPLSGQSVPVPERLRQMTEKEKAAYKARQDAAAAHANEMQRQINRGANAVAGGKGGFGETPEAVLKARADSEKKINELRIEQSRQTNLRLNSERLAAILLFSDQQTAAEQRAESSIKDIKINTQAEIAKARLDIFAQEKLTEAEKNKEFAAKEKELKLKEAADIAKSRVQITEQLQREQERIQDIITQSKARVEEETRLNDVLAQRNQFSIDNATATDKERERAQKLFDLEEERLRVLRQIALIKDIPPAERLAREQEINEIFAQRRQLTVEQQDADRNLQRDFASGFEKAYKQYVEDARDSFALAGRLFQGLTQGMEDAFVDFAKTGKFEFKGLINMMLEELLRSQIRQLMAGLFTGGTSSGGGGLLGGKIIPGILAGGGPVSSRRPYIVGEQGPELFVPNSAGSMMPNRDIGGGTSVTYNINAVDAPSFQAMIARDPSFIHAVAMQGAKGTPRRR
jgi:lambda family phage tail tape measure protein